ncbi:hypothetical protein IV203_010555 [Nitzschia inconspicua]|uniref:Uncharacterized protein n=1 Tax=Nitzschia inconspicua TaxID=303405 RepID=A0A9K3KXV6_9STRA|nr:hypothetical protein IV203_010555 [Nitzschia inconspicua]
MSSNTASILSTLSLSSLPSSLAWLMPAATTTRSRVGPVFQSQHQPGVFFGPEEEFECPDEEECEIDWDKMPGFDDDSTSEHNVETEASVHENSSIKNNNRLVVEYSNIDDDNSYDYDDDLQPKSYDHPVRNSLEKSRTFYEMSWQVDECNVEPDNCSDFCPDCAGSGRQFCKFCRGTRTIAFGSEFRTCIICDTDGRVECGTCRGTGGVAPWAMTHDKQST